MHAIIDFVAVVVVVGGGVADAYVAAAVVVAFVFVIVADCQTCSKCESVGKRRRWPFLFLE